MAGGQRESMRLRRDDGGAGLRPNTYFARDSAIPDVGANGIGDNFTILNVSATSVTQSVQTTGGPLDTPRFQRVNGTLAASGNQFGTKWQVGSSSVQSVIVGKQYGAGVFFKSTAWSVNATGTLKIEFFNVSNASTGSFTATITPTTSWQYLTIRGIAPAASIYMTVTAYAAATGNAGAISLDNADFRAWQGADPLTTIYDSALRSDFFYIPIELREGQTAIVIQDVGYDKAKISYDPSALPTDSSFGGVIEATIVRSPAGIPLTNLDGTEISRYVVGQDQSILNGGWLSVTDNDLTPGKWYYYGLFAKYISSGNTHWLRVGEGSVLIPYPFGYQDRFWDKIPEWYRRADREGPGSDDTLQRIVRLLGYEFDLHRTYASTVGDMWDMDKLSARLLPERGESLAQPMEGASGDKRYRNLIGNLLFLRKMKGTQTGVEGFLTALTGYKCVAYVGPNLILTDNNSEFTTSAGTWIRTDVTNDTITRTAGDGVGTNPPVGKFFMRLASINTTSHTQGAVSCAIGSRVGMIPVTAGNLYRIAANVQGSTAGTLVLDFEWWDGDVTNITTPISTNTAVSFGAVATTWARIRSSAVTAPANAKFLRYTIRRNAASTTNGLTTSFNDLIVVDTSWRPTGVPGMMNIEPLSTSLPGHYSDSGYYEKPRRIWINLYPQRVNLALNSNFELNNLPSGAWVASDVPTYDLIQRAYTDYADILDGAPGDGEVDYADLLASLNPLSGNWTVTFDTVNQQMVLDTSVTNSPWYMQTTSALFPVHSLSAWSAAAEVSSTHPSTKVRLSIRWYSANSTSNPVLDGAGNQVSTNGDYYMPGTGTTRAELHSAYPPVGATYGRLVIEATNLVADHTTYVRRVLIDNTALPGPYFNGSVTDGDYGDFFYINAPHTSYSAYYMSYRSFVTGVGGTDRIMTIMTDLLPPTRDYKILAANTGLYS